VRNEDPLVALKVFHLKIEMNWAKSYLVSRGAAEASTARKSIIKT
jgi:hypothetical protein